MRHRWAVAHAFVMLGLVGMLGACASARPAWTAKPPQGYEHDFYTGSGTGTDRAEARSAAISTAVARLAENGRLLVQVVRVDTSITTERLGNARPATLDRMDKTVQEIITKGESPSIRGLKLQEEYGEQVGTRHEAWVLMSVPKTTGLRQPPSRASFVLRSTLLPGWGQYAMGQERKGLFLGVGAALAVPAAVALGSVRQENLSKARNTQIAQSRDYYTSQANRQGTLMSVTIAAAVTLWGYGVVDAASSPSRLYVRNEGASTRVGFSIPTAFGN